jgi:hypothetical protein
MNLTDTLVSGAGERIVFAPKARIQKTTAFLAGISAKDGSAIGLFKTGR